VSEFDAEGFGIDLGLRLQTYRKRRRLTQQQVADQVGVPRPTYANIERGRCKAKVDLIWRVAIVLDVPISSLLPEPVLAGPDTGGTT
jgi:transcriptional regulator with XRE-family HTH domain